MKASAEYNTSNSAYNHVFFVSLLNHYKEHDQNNLDYFLHIEIVKWYEGYMSHGFASAIFQYTSR